MIKYEGYIEKQSQQIEAFKKLENKKPWFSHFKEDQGEITYLVTSYNKDDDFMPKK